MSIKATTTITITRTTMGTAMLAANVASLRYDSELGAETKPGTRCENYVLLHAQTFVFLLFSHG